MTLTPKRFLELMEAEGCMVRFYKERVEFAGGTDRLICRAYKFLDDHPDFEGAVIAHLFRRGPKRTRVALAQRVNYHEYMQSAAWRKVRNAAFKRDGYRCRMCGSGKNLQGHHVSYERLAKKGELDDVITLCEECHAKVHEVDLTERRLKS